MWPIRLRRADVDSLCQHFLQELLQLAETCPTDCRAFALAVCSKHRCMLPASEGQKMFGGRFPYLLMFCCEKSSTKLFTALKPLFCSCARGRKEPVCWFSPVPVSCSCRPR